MDISLKSILLSSKLHELLKSNGNKYSNSSDSKSLITVYEQQLYAWSDEEAVILYTDLSSTCDPKANRCKKLLPANPPIVEIETLLMSCLGNLLALVGRKGVIIMEIPIEVGKLRINVDEDSRIFCRSWTVADKIFTYSSHAILLQAAWFPGCKPSTDFMILSSDNYIRLYDIMNLPTPIQVISVGSNPRSSYISTNFSLSLPTCLGESAIGFDIGLPEYTCLNKFNDNDSQEMTCPIYVLHGNGDVYVVKTSVKNNGSRSAKLLGPLAMYPPAEDNYGVDACTLLCLHSNPPVLVLAMASGILYHCLVLDESSETEEDSQLSWQMNKANIPALYVHGSVQLPMFITPEDDVYSRAIRLYRDISTPSKYHCSMVCGVHSVAIPFIKKMEECSVKGSNEAVITELLENDCIVEHLLCTQPLNSVNPIPVIGLTSIIQSSRIHLICLLASWEFQCFSLLSSFASYAPSLLSSEIKLPSEDDNKQQESFEDHIKQILNRTTGTPIIKCSSDTDISSKQCLDLIYGTTHHFKDEYIKKFFAAQEQIKQRAKVLTRNKLLQMQELECLVKNKEELQKNSVNLIEKYDDSICKQQELFQRIDAVLRILGQRFPCLSNAEINMKSDLQNIKEKLKPFQNSLDQLKKKLKLYKQGSSQHNLSVETVKVTTQLSNMHLGETQLKHVKELLKQEGDSVQKLMRDVSSLKN